MGGAGGMGGVPMAGAGGAGGTDAAAGATSGAGGIGGNGGVLATGPVWTQRGTLQDWTSVASSADGTKLGGQNRRLEVFLNNAVSGKRQSGRMTIGGGDVQSGGWRPADRLVL